MIGAHSIPWHLGCWVPHYSLFISYYCVLLIPAFKTKRAANEYRIPINTENYGPEIHIKK